RFGRRTSAARSSRSRARVSRLVIGLGNRTPSQRFAMSYGGGTQRSRSSQSSSPSPCDTHTAGAESEGGAWPPHPPPWPVSGPARAGAVAGRHAARGLAGAEGARGALGRDRDVVHGPAAPAAALRAHRDVPRANACGISAGAAVVAGVDGLVLGDVDDRDGDR